MGGGMPYGVEKGVALRVIEQQLNGTREKMGLTLTALRDVDEWPGEWVVRVLPDVWRDEGLDVRTTRAPHVLKDWFGLVEDPPGSGRWAEPTVEPPTTGYWIGYRGKVEPIVKRAFVWALELSLGVAPGANPPPTSSATARPDPIELFWACPSPWFEAWVIRRPVDRLGGDAGADRGPGLITVLFTTPSHTGANLAESPVTTAPLALHHPGTGKLLDHPVPSLEIDYERLGQTWAHGHLMGGNRPREDAHKRRYATWVVTHEQHVNQVVPPTAEPWTSTRPSPLGRLDAPLLNTYRGTGDVVVVSPSLRAGGVTHDGVVSKHQAVRFGPKNPPSVLEGIGGPGGSLDEPDEDDGYDADEEAGR